jgi:phospholipid/cholesterol/gamma-HCH transport system substrate-binding protein
METKANYLVIGAFVLAIIGAGFSFVYWMKNYSVTATVRQYQVIFHGSVQGLSEGSNVLFNGLRVGAVQTLGVIPEDTRKVRALIIVQSDAPVRETSRARITQVGLAGIVALELTPGSPESPLLAPRPGEPAPIILADVAAGGGLMSGASEAVGNANALFARLNDLVANNETSVSHAIKNLEAFTAMLDERKGDISQIIQDVKIASGRIQTLADKLESALGSDKNSVVTQMQQAAESFHNLGDKLDKSLGDQAPGLTQQAQRGLREFELFMKDARRLAESLDRVVQKVENNPSGFLMGGSQVPVYKPAH